MTEVRRFGSEPDCQHKAEFYLFRAQCLHRIDERGATCLAFASRTPLHSARRATTGSTRAARCAGNQQASATAAERTAPPPIHAKTFGAGISAQ